MHNNNNHYNKNVIFIYKKPNSHAVQCLCELSELTKHFPALTIERQERSTASIRYIFPSVKNLTLVTSMTTKQNDFTTKRELFQSTILKIDWIGRFRENINSSLEINNNKIYARFTRTFLKIFVHLKF